jgi:hypothetical protein
MAAAQAMLDRFHPAIHNRGKALDGGRTTPTGVLDKPPDAVLRALLGLKAEHLLRGNNVRLLYSEAMQKYPHLHAIAQYPGLDTDQLFLADYSHVASEPSCHECDHKMLKERPPRPDDQPKIFYGLIASGNKVIKDARVRDELAKQYGILCFETEAAGIMDIFPCLVIRGVCDYSDSHKNKSWQGYAAVMAAAYTKEFLLHLPSHDMLSAVAMVEKLAANAQLPEPEELAVLDLNLSPLPESTWSALQPCDKDTSGWPPTLGSNPVQPNVSASLSSTPPGYGLGEDGKLPVQVTGQEPKLTYESQAASEDISSAALVQPSTGECGKHQDISSSGSRGSCPEIEGAPPNLRRIPSGLASRINSQYVFEINLALSRTRKSWHPWPGDCDALFHSLKAWLSTTTFQGLIVGLETGGMSMTPRHTRGAGFATEVIDFLLQWKTAHKEPPPESDYQVVWALPSTAAASNASNDASETLKLIISDLIRLNPDVLSPDEISNMPRFTERELWLLLETTLARVKRTFVVFHSNILYLTSSMLRFANNSTFPSGDSVKIMMVVSDKDVVTNLNRDHDRWRVVHMPREPPVSAQLRRRPVGHLGWQLVCPKF